MNQEKVKRERERERKVIQFFVPKFLSDICFSNTHLTAVERKRIIRQEDNPKEKKVKGSYILHLV